MTLKGFISVQPELRHQVRRVCGELKTARESRRGLGQRCKKGLKLRPLQVERQRPRLFIAKPRLQLCASLCDNGLQRQLRCGLPRRRLRQLSL